MLLLSRIVELPESCTSGLRAGVPDSTCNLDPDPQDPAIIILEIYVTMFLRPTYSACSTPISVCACGLRVTCKTLRCHNVFGNVLAMRIRTSGGGTAGTERAGTVLSPTGEMATGAFSRTSILANVWEPADTILGGCEYLTRGGVASYDGHAGGAQRFASAPCRCVCWSKPL